MLPETAVRLAVALALLAIVGLAVAGPGFVPGGGQQAVAPEVTGSYTPGDTGAIGADGTVTTDTTPAKGDETESLPPGVGPDRLRDVSELAEAHAEAIRNRPYHLRVEASGPPNATWMSGRTEWNYTVRVESPAHYRYDGRFVFANPENRSETARYDVAIYADGETKFRRVVAPDGTTYQRYAVATTDDARGYAENIRQRLVWTLQGEHSSVTCVGTLGSGECFDYRVQVTGDPVALEDDVEDYRAVAVVSKAGLVTSLQVRYTLPDDDGDGQREVVRFGVTYDDIGDVRVSPPAWLDEAKNATDTSATPTATPTATENGTESS